MNGTENNNTDPNNDTDPPYFKDFFNMDLESLINYVKNYYQNPENTLYTNIIKTDEDINLPDIFNFLRPADNPNILRSKNQVLFDYPNIVDGRLDLIKRMQDPYNEIECSKMIKYGLYNASLDFREIDLIISPKSTSKILEIFSKETSDYITKYKISTNKQTDINVIKDCFLKLKWKDIEIDNDAIDRMENFEAAYNFLDDIADIKRNHGDEDFRFGAFYLGDIRRRYLIKKFMKIDERFENRIKASKNILIIDDFTTNGATRKQMTDLVEEINPSSNVINLAIFKIVSR